MMFDNVLIHYLFILLLSVHLTVSQTDSTDSTYDTETVSSITSADESSMINTEQTTTDEQSTDTPPTSPISVENTFDTSTFLSSTIIQEITSSSSDTESSIISSEDSSTTTGISSEQTMPTGETTGIEGNETDSSTVNNNPATISEASVSDITESGSSDFSDLIVTGSSTTIISPTGDESTSFGLDDTGSPLPTTSENSPDTEQSFSDTSEITPISTDTVFPESSTIGTTFSASTETELYQSLGTEDTSTSSDITSQILRSTETIESATSLSTTQISFTDISDTTEISVIVTGATDLEASEQSTPSSLLSTEPVSPDTADTFSFTIVTITTESIGSMPSSETISSTITDASPFSAESTSSHTDISTTEIPTSSANSELSTTQITGPSEPSSESTAARYEPSTTVVTNGATDTISSSVTDASSLSSTSSSFLPVSFETSAPSLSSSSNGLSSASISEKPTIESTASKTSFEDQTGTDEISTLTTSQTTTTNTPIPTITTTSTATTTSSIGIVPPQPISVIFEVNQAINSTGLPYNLTSEEGRKELIKSLNDDLSPELAIRDYTFSNCPGINCTIIYNVTYKGYTNPNTTVIEKYITDRKPDSFSKPTVTRSSDPKCSNGQDPPNQNDCFYCGTESPCAELPESSKCMVRDYDTQQYYCKCDQSKQFFRTNYEYDERCSRNAILWWPQMLVICLLVFIIFLLVLGLIMLCRRRQRRISKRLKQEPAVMSNAPQKTSDFEYIELNNFNQLSNDNISTYPNIRRPRPIYLNDRSNDYVYRRRLPQNYTYPSRSHPYVQRGVLPNDFFTLDREVNRDFHLTGDIDDDEIYV